jgi:ParB family transcriptional regulator, chromosome partitioning protein
MGKRDDLMRDAGNIRESMGVGVPLAADGASTSSVPAHLRGVDRMRDAKMIPLDLIEPDPGQPRKAFDPEGLSKLADSLRKRGQIQPIMVCWNDAQAAYVILAGERRWRAARQAGLEKLACIVRDQPLTEGELRAVQLIENCLREDLRPLEQAHAYRSLMAANDWSARRLAEELDLNHATVLRALALLGLPGDIQERVARGELAPSAAAELARLEPDEAKALAEQAAAEKLTRDQVAEAVRARVNPAADRPARPKPLEVRLDDGIRIIIHGAADPEVAAAALKRAIKKLVSPGRGADAA